MKPCKHLDYETEYGPDIKLVDLLEFPGVRYWFRGERWTNNGPGQKPNPGQVQFCKLKGRINSIFDCYEPGTMPCHEEADTDS